MKNIYRNVALDPSKFTLLDKETGEEIGYEKGSINQIKETKLVRIDFKNYVYHDTDKLIELPQKGLKLHHIGLLSVLAANIRYGNNAVVNSENVPLSTKDISIIIGKSENATKVLLNELEKFGLLYYGKIYDFKKKVYILNPHFVRKGKNFSKNIIGLFFPEVVSSTQEKQARLNEKLKE
jgi:hypothetical protein